LRSALGAQRDLAVVGTKPTTMPVRDAQVDHTIVLQAKKGIRHDGTSRVRPREMRLYRFPGDGAHGCANGEAIRSFGSAWQWPPPGR
jgi:hypothetical protein